MKTTRLHHTLLASLLLIMTLAGCSTNQSSSSKNQAGDSANLRDVKVVLDWTPNTNHTGLYVAKEKGYYEAEGLNVEIVLPGSTGADMMVASGEAPFGVSYQESVTLARTQEVPLVSIAAVIQHNTSGFAAPVDRGIKSPKEFEGKSYGGWGSPVEEAIMGSIMKKENADVSTVRFINMGEADFFTAVERDIDFAWIFYAWTGIEAELRNQPLDMLYVKDYAEELDYYTPVLITNEQTIAEDPELVQSFMRATAKGYETTIADPEEAAEVLLKAVPELDRELVVNSQKWLSPKYKDDAARWGEQKEEVWVNYAQWLSSHQLLEGEFDAKTAYTNEFLPQE